MIRFKYEWATADQRGDFTVDEHSESIANVEAKDYVASLVNPSSLLSFDLVCRGPAS